LVDKASNQLFKTQSNIYNVTKSQGCFCFSLWLLFLFFSITVELYM